jgi:hypothetical protein
VDAVGRDLLDRILPRLVALTGLEAERAGIHADLATALARQPGVSSTLTGGQYPVELAVIIAARRPLGLKYTVDSRAGGALPRLAEAAADGLGVVVDPLVGSAGRADLGRYLRRLAEASSGEVADVYCSVTRVPDAEARPKVYLVGGAGVFDRAVLERLVGALGRREALETCFRILNALGRTSVDILGFAIRGGRVSGCAAYVSTPYFDFRMVTRLVTGSGLPVGHAIALLRWYRRFVGPYAGRLGLFGIGFDLTHPPRAAGLEAYVGQPGAQLGRLRRAIDRLAGATRRPASRSTLEPVWALTGDPHETPAPASLRLAACGVETAPRGRFGRATVYLGVTGGAERLRP